MAGGGQNGLEGGEVGLLGTVTYFYGVPIGELAFTCIMFHRILKTILYTPPLQTGVLYIKGLSNSAQRYMVSK